jgi:hypothetical protein
MGPIDIPLAAHVVNQQAPAAWRHRPSEGVRLVPELVGLARSAPNANAEFFLVLGCDLVWKGSPKTPQNAKNTEAATWPSFFGLPSG